LFNIILVMSDNIDNQQIYESIGILIDIEILKLFKSRDDIYYLTSAEYHSFVNNPANERLYELYGIYKLLKNKLLN